MLGIYIHIPFCLKRCGYCDFCSSVQYGDKIEAYTQALVRNIEACKCKGEKVDTVYFGGGTPSLLLPSQLSKILGAVRKTFDLSPICEITVEANPGTVDRTKLTEYRLAGVNRISFGVQSCKDNELYRLGRLHNFSQAAEAVSEAKEAGFDNISCDLMIGIPEQTKQSLAESIDKICGLGIQHVSAYMLKIESGTAFDCPQIRAEVPDDDEVAEMYLQTVKMLSERGFAQYEISNFSKSGYESAHNLKYWTGEQYLGFGASAHSFYGGRRFYVPDDIDLFTYSDLQTTEAEEAPSDPLTEYILLGLRLSKGITLDKIASFGGDEKSFEKAAEPFLKAGLINSDNRRFWLSPEGFLVSNGIILRLIESQN